jgi:putative transposase
MKLSRSSFSYKAKVSDDSQIRQKMLDLADKHKRYGFRKIFHLLKKSGLPWNHKRAYRIYCELKLNLKRKPKKRLPVREKVALGQPAHMNHTWSLDYMSDVLISGKRFRTANVIDDHNREALGIKASSSLPAKRITEFLDDIALSRGYPKELRMDNGPENISHVMDQWARDHNITLKFIEPGKPAQNGYIERFNRTYREEILDMYLFRNIDEVQRLTNEWIQEYNSERPHHSLGNLTPCEYASGKNFSTFELY